MSKSCCNIPEDWVNETAVKAKRELSIFLSAVVPSIAALVVALLLFVNVGGWLALAGKAIIVIVVLTPLSIIGFLTSDHRTRRVTVPLTVLSLLIFAVLAVVYLAI